MGITALFLFRIRENSSNSQTSAIQKVNLTSAVDYRILPQRFGIENRTDAPAITVFLPTNAAWRRLPPSLKLYLFSPIGRRALKKLLQFHIVPDHVIHAGMLDSSIS